MAVSLQRSDDQLELMLLLEDGTVLVGEDAIAAHLDERFAGPVETEGRPVATAKARRPRRKKPAPPTSVAARGAELPALAEAKLSAPRVQATIVQRPRVLRALDAGEGMALTLVSAPPGYGKTTAVRDWCASRETSLAWVTLDAGDNDPVRLWTYVATAVDRVRSGLGRSALQQLSRNDVAIEHGSRRADERHRRPAGRSRHRARRCADGDGRGVSRIHRLLHRPSARDGAARADHARRSGTTARACTGQGRSGRAAGDRPRVHLPGGARARRRARRPRSLGRGDRVAARANGGVGRGTLPRDTLAPNRRRPRSRCPRLRRRSAFRCRVSES